MLMMMHRTGANLDDDLLPTIHHHHDYQEQSIIINSTCQISWKLYDNPIFSSATNTSISPLKLKPKQLQRKYSASAKFVHHHIHSDHKMITNNNTVSSPKSNTSSSDNVGYHHHHHQLNQAKIQVAELRAELEMERKLRKKMEALNKKLSKELVDQAQHQKERVVGVCDCEDLMKEISRLKEETEKMKKEMEEERKMLRMAEVLREERVQMKLADAHMFYHHNVLNQFLLQQEKNPTSIEESKNKFTSSSSSSDQQKCLNVTTAAAAAAASGCISGKNVIRKASPEPENPHIKQGIKGFVEFQRAIKAKNGCNYPSNNYSSGNSSKQSKDNIGGFNKVECQKAQLRVLFKQKYPLPYSHHDHLIIS